MDRLETALYLRGLGYDVIPVGCVRGREFRPKDPGLVKGWQEKQWTDDELKDAMSYSRRGIGLRLSLDTLIDIEADTKEADDFAADLFAEVETVSWRGAGQDGHYPGVHRLFRLTDDQRAVFERHNLNSKTLWPAGIEVRTAGQSVLPPSGGREWVIFPSGGDKEAADKVAAELPDEIFRELVGCALLVKRGEEIDKDRNLMEELDRLLFNPELEKDTTDYKISASPGDDFCQRADWAEVLTPHGWKVQPDGMVIRPGKTEGVSGTTTYCHSDTRGDLLYIFSTAPEIAPLEAHLAYSKFEAYTILNHEGDYSGAASELRRKGYGSEASPVELFDDLSCFDEPITKVAETVAPPPVSKICVPDEVFSANAIGRYCRALREFTKADPLAVYLQALEIFGALVGRNRWYTYGPSRRYLTDYLIITGETGSGKGVAFDYAKLIFTGEGAEIFSPVAEAYSKMVMGRMGSGEGLIEALLAKGENDFNPQHERCLLLVEQEGIGSFKKMTLESSTVTDTLLKAWDSNSLSNCTKGRSLYVPNPLVSLIWHVTPDVVESLPVSFLHGGLINRLRFFLCSKPEKPDNPQSLPEPLISEVRTAVEKAFNWISEGEQEITFAPGAERVLERVKEYQHRLSGVTATANERYAAHVERMACRLALLGCEAVVDQDAIEAAWELHKACFASAESLLLAMKYEGSGSGFAGKNANRAESILQFVEDHPGQTFTKTQLRQKVFNSNAGATEMDLAIAAALETGRLKSGKRKEGSAGKNVTRYWGR